jgi:HK97 family phage prohead protease
MAVSDRPWSDFTQADYTPAQWARACLIDTMEGPVDSKARYKFPIREPSGVINRNGVHAAAARLSQANVPADMKAATARKLVAIYRNDLGEDPPESLLSLAGRAQPATTGVLYRATHLDAGSSGRELFGRIVPYNQTIEVNDGVLPYLERFEYGSLSRSIRERAHKIRLLAQHDRHRFPVGKALELNEHPDGVHGVFAVANTSDGNDLLELVRCGLVAGFSVGFMPVKDRTEGGVTVRTEASLREVSAVSEPAYPGAEIAGIRSAESPFITRSLAAARLRLATLGGTHHV